MKLQLHQDYMLALLLAFFVVMGYAARTIVGELIAIACAIWLTVMILAGIVRVVKRIVH